ncbi:hypothetical protein [Arthrobacter sp. AD-310]
MAQLNPYRRAGAVITAACTCWFLGISMLGNIHTVTDAATRLEMLGRHRRLWILGQFLAATGTAAAPVGFIRLAQQFQSRPAEVPGKASHLAVVAAGALSAGSPLFIVALADRAAHLRRFAFREGASWPFLTYAGLQTAGVGALGAALQLSAFKGAVAASSVASTPLFATILVRSKDIPPFVFYLLQLAVGIKLLRYQPEMPGKSDV